MVEVFVFVVSLFSFVTLLFWSRSSFGEADAVLDTRGDTASAEGEEPVGKAAYKYRGSAFGILALFIVFFFLYVGTEMSLANFMPAILIEKLGVMKETAALSITCFWVAMSVGRIFAGTLAEKIHYRVYVLLSCLLTLMMLIIFPFAEQVWAAFTIILMLGLFMSGLFSIALVFASKLLEGSEESTPSILIASGGIGGAILPLVTGWSLIISRFTRPFGYLRFLPLVWWFLVWLRIHCRFDSRAPGQEPGMRKEGSPVMGIRALTRTVNLISGPR